MKKLPRPGFGIRLLSSLLCLIIFVSMLAGILIADIRIITTKENTSKIIRESLFISHTVRPAAARPGSGSGHGAIAHGNTRFAMPRLAEEDTAGVMTEALVEFVYESMTEQYGELPITLEEVEEFIDQSTLKDEISDLSASLINDLVTGENTTVIDEEMITGLVMDNADLIEEYFQVTVDEEAISQMAQELVQSDAVVQIQEEGISQVLLDSMTGGGHRDPSLNNPYDETLGGDSGSDSGVGSGNENIGSGNAAPNVAEIAQVLQDIRAAISSTAMIICFGIAAFCALLLFLLNRKWIWYPLRKLGVALIFAALPMLIPTIVVIAMVDVWTGLFISMAVVGTVIAMMLTMTAPVCLGTAGFGALCILTSIIVKSVTKHRLKKAAAAEAAAEVAAVEAPAQEVLPEPVAAEEPAEEAAPVEEASAEDAPAEEEVPVE